MNKDNIQKFELSQIPNIEISPIQMKIKTEGVQSSDQVRNRNKKEKLTFKELKLIESLPSEIDKLTLELDRLDTEIEKYNSDFSKLTVLTEKKEALELELLDKMEQYETLKEKEALIATL